MRSLVPSGIRHNGRGYDSSCITTFDTVRMPIAATRLLHIPHARRVICRSKRIPEEWISSLTESTRGETER